MELTPLALYKILGCIGYVICLWETSRVFRPASPFASIWNKGACIILVGALPLAALLNAVGINIWEGTLLLCFLPIFATYVIIPILRALLLMVDGLKAQKS